MSTIDQIAQEHADGGYDVFQRAAGDIVLDVPNPRPWDDDYYHGENPNRVGYGSRGPASERATASGEDRRITDGESTAEAQQRAGGLGWNEQAGAVQEGPAYGAAGEQPGGGEETGGGAGETGEGEEAGPASEEPDGSWTNDALRTYAEDQGIDIGNARNKSELLGAINAHRAQAGA